LRFSLRYLHISRTVVFFDEDGILANQIIIDPKWLIDAFRCLITNTCFVEKSQPTLYLSWIEFTKTAKLTRRLLDSAWSRYPKARFLDHKEALLAFMERFGLIALPVKFDKDEDYDEEFFFVPSVLQEPDFGCILNLERNQNSVASKSLCFVIDHDFLPLEIHDRVIAGCVQTFRRFPFSGVDKANSIKRGFGFFKIDEFWSLIVCCRGSIITLTLLNTTNNNNLDCSVGSGIRKIMEDMINRILKMNRQENITYSYALHCCFKLEALEKSTPIGQIQRQGRVKCCEGNRDKEEHFLTVQDIKLWGFQVAYIVCYLYI